MTKKIEKSTQKKIEENLSSLSEESKRLVEERRHLENRSALINQRLHEIQGAVNVLLPLRTKKAT